MKRDHYACDNGLLVIKDQELKLNISVPFSPMHIPKRAKAGQCLGTEMYIRKIGDGLFIEKEGQFDGQAVIFYPEGKMKMESFYLNGVLHGPSSFFSKAGKLLSKSWFVNGLQQGKSHWYDQKGQLISLQKYRDGVWDGVQEFYFPDGKLKTKMGYSKGKLQESTELYYSNGKPKQVFF